MIAANLRALILPSLWIGFWIGIFVYVYVFFFVGWSTLALRFDVLTREFWIATQYVTLGITLTLIVCVTASVFFAIRRRRLRMQTAAALEIAAFLFVLILIPLEVLWVIGHRLSDPTDLSSWVLPASIFLLSAIAAVGGYFASLRFRDARAIRNLHLNVIAVLVVTSAALLSQSLLLEGRVSVNRSSRKIVIIGLDGANWSVIDPIIARGQLPNLQSLIKSGTSGLLTSMEPMESPRVWTSIATGKTPAKHGIEQWVVDRRFIRTSTLWEIAEASGKHVGLYDWLVTHPPPKKANGFVIPGWLAGGKTSTYPEKLERTLMLVRSLQHPFWFLRLVVLRAPPAFIAELRGDPKPRLIETEFIRADFVDFDVPYLRATYNPDILAVVFYGTDVIAHHQLSWKSGAANGRLQEYYRKVDGIIGRIIHHYPPPTTFVVVSDHGLRPLKDPKKVVYIRADRMLSDLQLSSVAQVVGGGNNYSLIGLTEVSDQTSLQKVAEAFSASPAFQVEINGKVIRLTYNPKYKADARYLRQVSISADHDLEGILILNGPGIRSGHRISGASVLDITPSLLYVMGLPVGQDMDGHVLTQAFTETRLQDATLRYIPTYDKNRNAEDVPTDNHVDPEVLERLQALGYLK